MKMVKVKSTVIPNPHHQLRSAEFDERLWANRRKFGE